MVPGADSGGVARLVRAGMAGVGRPANNLAQPGREMLAFAGLSGVRRRGQARFGAVVTAGTAWAVPVCRSVAQFG